MGILQAGIMEWAAIPSSRGPSQLRDQTQVCCIAGRFFYRLSHQGKPLSLSQAFFKNHYILKKKKKIFKNRHQSQ